ncbi:type I restriction-modification system subunit M [Chrysosporum bergii ANA360D]|uniref:site-specific DNA-methyltransferase (adenine-specific) n=1 Tax=Chrysosporum bergii ANA360D TaxID=617107 RepID=A0AA43GQY5_9CYAN|nr:type I restriction-modification system subunit M [Chrysosporum bergii]MDH6060007.1 type I restriction-modification system subunit M [Chrysosporum bergii ANA360D]
MTVLRRLDCLLEPSKDKVLELYKKLEAGDFGQNAIAQQLPRASGYVFYNTSEFTFKTLLDFPSNIKANFENYLDGFSDNVQEIISKFKLRNQLETLVESNRLYALIQKFVAKEINLSAEPVTNEKGEIQEGLTNLGMGYVFEELIRKFNEENNEEAGEHFTPRDIIQLMVNLIFLPIENQIQSGTYLVYDDACGSGGMLTESEAFIQQLAEKSGKKVTIELYGQEVNPETYAICQSDMLIKGRDPDKIYYGSTISKDKFADLQFDFMLANPPYGKSWTVDQEAIMEGKKKEVIDPRFAVEHPGLKSGEKLTLLPRTSDGQLLFLVNMLSKMKQNSTLGSRIAIVHNGSALFTGDAGQGESNIRRWIIENDWLECIIGLPLNMFYNTGIATYIWVLSNRKPEHRKGKVQLIDATEWYGKLRKNLGKKNCELTQGDIKRITETFLDFQETEQSKIFDNADFGYHKITVDRPLRLSFQVTPERIEQFITATQVNSPPKKASKAQQEIPLNIEVESKYQRVVEILKDLFNGDIHTDFNQVKQDFEKTLKVEEIKLTSKDLKLVYDTFTQKDESAQPVIKKKTKEGIIYEPDSELRDTENVPLKEDIEEYFQREVLPHVPDAWIDEEKTVRGYEISFTKYFYKFKPLRSLEEIKADILALEAEAEGVLHQIVKGEG